MTVEEMIDAILVREGGFVNHPDDRGGPTNHGVTQATLSDYLQRDASVQDVKDLDIDTARDIYKKRYYQGPKIDLLPEPIQPFIFDCAINHGPRHAIKFVQKICNESGFGQLSEDGLMGSKTAAGADQCCKEMGKWMFLTLIQERKQFYLEIVVNDSSQKTFLKGWMNRANSFLEDLEEA